MSTFTSGVIVEITDVAFTAMRTTGSKTLSLLFQASSKLIDPKALQTTENGCGECLGGGWVVVSLVPTGVVGVAATPPSAFIIAPNGSNHSYFEPVVEQRRLLLPLIPLTHSQGAEMLKECKVIVAVDKRKVVPGAQQRLASDITEPTHQRTIEPTSEARRFECPLGSSTAQVTFNAKLHPVCSLAGVECLALELELLVTFCGREVLRNTWDVADVLTKMLKTAITDPSFPLQLNEDIIRFTSSIVTVLRTLRFPSVTRRSEWVNVVRRYPTVFADACNGLHQHRALASTLLVPTNEMRELVQRATCEWENPRRARFRCRLDELASTRSVTLDGANTYSDAATFIEGASSTYAALSTAASTFMDTFVSSAENGGGDATVLSQDFGTVVAFLSDTAGLLQPLVEALPFGRALVGLMGELYTCFTARRDLLEQSGTLTLQLSMLVRVLLQPSVCKLIARDEGTQYTLEELFCAVDECCETMEDYIRSNTLFQFFGASRVAASVKNCAECVTSHLERLTHLVSLRTLAFLHDHAVSATQVLVDEKKMLLTATTSIDALTAAIQTTAKGVQDALMAHVTASEARVADLIHRQVHESAVCELQHELVNAVHLASQASISAFIATQTSAECATEAAMAAIHHDVQAKLVQIVDMQGVTSAASIEMLTRFREYVITELIPSMLMAHDGAIVDQQAATEALNTALLDSVSAVHEKRCSRLEMNLIAAADKNFSESMRELRRISSNVQSTAGGLEGKLQLILNNVRATEETMTAALDEHLKAAVKGLTVANSKEMQEIMSEGFDKIHASVNRLAIDSDLRAELLLRRVLGSIAEITNKAMLAFEEQHKDVYALLKSGDKKISALDERQANHNDDVVVRMIELRAHQDAILNELRNIQPAFGTFPQMIGINATLSTTQRSLAVLEKLVPNIEGQKIALQALKETIEDMELSNEQNTVNIIAKILDAKIFVESEFQDVRTLMRKYKGVIVKDLTGVIATQLDKAFRKRMLSSVTKEMLEAHLSSVKAACGGVFDGTAIDKITNTVNACLGPMVTDMQELSNQTNLLALAAARSEEAVVRATRVTTAEVFEGQVQLSKFTVTTLGSQIESSFKNLENVLRDVLDVHSRGIHDGLAKIQRAVEYTGFQFDAATDFDESTKERALGRCLALSITAIRSAVGDAYREKFETFTGAFSRPQAHADVMFTRLRMVAAPRERSEGARVASDALRSSMIDATEVVHAMKAIGRNLMLVEGRAGVGKTCFAMQMCRLQNFDEGITVLITLSSLAAYVEASTKGRPNSLTNEQHRISIRELLYLSFLDHTNTKCLLDPSIIELIHFGDAPILWIIDGLDEVLSSTNPFIVAFLHAFTTVRGLSENPISKHRSHDLVMLTSREERGSHYKHDDIPVMAIDFWTISEVHEFVRKYFESERQDKDYVAKAVSMVDKAIRCGRLGPFAKLPIMTEMLCMHFKHEYGNQSSDVITRKVISLDAAELYSTSLERLYHRQNRVGSGKQPVTADYARVLTRCTKAAYEAIDSHELTFVLDIADPIDASLFHSGLIQSVDESNSPFPKVKFPHKSFLEYFAALYVEQNISLLLETRKRLVPVKWRSNPASRHSVAVNRAEFIACSGVEPCVYVTVGADLCNVVLQIRCDTPNVKFSVLWIAKSQLTEYRRRRTTYRPLQSSDPFSKTWTSTNSFCEVRGKLSQGEYCLMVQHERPYTLLVSLQHPTTTVTGEVHRVVAFYTDDPFADILEDRQQRNFLSLLAMMVSDNGTNTSDKQDALTKFVVGRFKLHVQRTSLLFGDGSNGDAGAQSVCSRSRSVADHVMRTSCHTTGAMSNSSVAATAGLDFLRTHCGMDLVIELSRIGAVDVYKDALETLALQESSSFFSRLLQMLGAATTSHQASFWHWMIVPCARHGSQVMLKHAESKIVPTQLQSLQQGEEYKKALVQAMMNHHDDIVRYLQVTVAIDLQVACSIGCEEAVTTVLLKRPVSATNFTRAVAYSMSANQFHVVLAVIRERNAVPDSANLLSDIVSTIVNHFVQHQRPASILLQRSLVHLIKESVTEASEALVDALYDNFSRIFGDTWTALLQNMTLRLEICKSMHHHFSSLALALRLNQMWVSELVSQKVFSQALTGNAFTEMLMRSVTLGARDNILHICLKQKHLHAFVSAIQNHVNLANPEMRKSWTLLFAAKNREGQTPAKCAVTSRSCSFLDAVKVVTTLAAALGCANATIDEVIQSAPSWADALEAVRWLLDELVAHSSVVEGILNALLNYYLSSKDLVARTADAIEVSGDPRLTQWALAVSERARVCSTMEVSVLSVRAFLTVVVLSACIGRPLLPRCDIVARLKQFQTCNHEILGSASPQQQSLFAALETMLRPLHATVVPVSVWTEAFPMLGSIVRTAVGTGVVTFIASAVFPELLLLNRRVLGDAKRSRLLSVMCALQCPVQDIDMSGWRIHDTILLGAVFQKCILKDVMVDNAQLKGSSFPGCNVEGMRLSECDLSSITSSAATNAVVPSPPRSVAIDLEDNDTPILLCGVASTGAHILVLRTNGLLSCFAVLNLVLVSQATVQLPPTIQPRTTFPFIDGLRIQFAFDEGGAVRNSIGAFRVVVSSSGTLARLNPFEPMLA